MNYIELGYFGLFLVSFLAATILPLTSEGVLLLFLASGFHPTTCLLVASSGNILGGLTNYFIGLQGNPEKLQRHFQNPARFRKIFSGIRKYGYWLGLLSWTPVIGDPLTIAMGYFRVRFIPFLFLMSFGKILRYWLIIFLWNQ